MGNWDEAAHRRDPDGRFAPKATSGEAGVTLAAPLNECRGDELPPLAFEHNGPYDPAAVAPVSNDGWMKPTGGVWLSPVTGQGTSWGSYRRAEGLRPAGTVTPLALDAQARVLVIDSLPDLLAARERYDPGPFEHTTMNSNGIDFEAASAEYDAVHLTAAGVAATRYNPGGPHLYAWDVESVLVLRPEALRPA